MGNLMNYKHNKHYGLSQGFGHKVKDIVKLAGTVKGIYDTAKTVYTIGTTMAPYVSAALPLLGVL